MVFRSLDLPFQLQVDVPPDGPSRRYEDEDGHGFAAAARFDELVVTERGRPIATIVPYREPPSGNSFKTRKLRPGYAALLGRLRGGTDSATIVSEDRDRS